MTQITFERFSDPDFSIFPEQNGDDKHSNQISTFQFSPVLKVGGASVTSLSTMLDELLEISLAPNPSTKQVERVLYTNIRPSD